MVQLLNFDIPNIYLGGGTAGIIIVAIFFWIYLRRSGGDRISLQDREIQRDEQILHFHRNAKNEEKQERSDAERLKSLFIDFYLRAVSMNMHDKDLDQTYNYVVGALDAIIREKMDLKSTTADFQNLSNS